MAKDKDKEREDVDLTVVITDAEYKIASLLISERRMHRETLSNLHVAYKREDARRILDSLPYNGCQMLPLVRSKEVKNTLSWTSSDTIGLAADLKLKFEFFCRHGKDFDATAAHSLMKKVEDAQVKSKKRSTSSTS